MHLRGVIASIGVSLLGVAHPLCENISSAGYKLVDGSHSGLRGSRKPTCGWYSSFCKTLERTSFSICM